MNRIESILFFIDKKDAVIDVGCDQAKLGILLAKRGQKSIASDISEKVINRAYNDVNLLGYSDLITFKVSDGLDNILEKVDTLVLSGMGTYTIINILSKTKIIFKKIITISNNNHDVLRSKMNGLNYKVSKEMIIKEKNKYYNLIVFVQGNKEYTEEELLLGLNHVNEELHNEYLDYLLNKYQRIKKSSKDKSDKINKLINIISHK